MRNIRWVVALATLVGAAAFATGAGASHGPAELISSGPAGGNGPVTAVYAGSSEDGNRVFFETLERLVAADTDNRTDVYERAHGVTSLLSSGPAGGNGSMDAFFYGSSADGTVVLFGTAERLVGDDTDSAADVYEHAGGTTSLVSTGPSGGNGPQGAFFDGASADGSHVFFHTTERIVNDDVDTQADVYERSAGTTVRVSTGPAGGNGAFPAFFDGASADGSRVFFDTDERIMVSDTDSVQDVYERTAGSSSLVSIGPNGGNGPFPAFFDAVSDDGTRVTLATDEVLAAPDVDNAFDVYQRDGGVMDVLSATPDAGNDGSDALYAGSSRDGLRVFFQTQEQLAPGDGDAQVDIFERSGTAFVRRSAGNGAFDAVFAGAAADGSHVLYETEEQVLGGDTDADVDVYDSAGTTALVSTGPTGGNGVADAFFAGVSDDGARSFFTTAESLVGSDSDSSADIYESAAGATSLVSTGTDGGNGAFDAMFAGASADGTTAIFTTVESLAAGDTDSSADVYAARTLTGYPRPLSASPVRVSLVPAYEPCSSPTGTHGAPLAFDSCAPPQQSSQQLTVGTSDANGQPAASVGLLRLRTIVGNPSTSLDEADVSVRVSITDVRQQSDLSDYSGDLTASFSARLTDRDGPATVQDFPFDVVTPCAATGSAAGGSCAVDTTFDAIAPGAVVEGKRAIWQLAGVEVRDADGGVFARQGIFVP